MHKELKFVLAGYWGNVKASALDGVYPAFLTVRSLSSDIALPDDSTVAGI